jgi:hypothetical protein
MMGIPPHIQKLRRTLVIIIVATIPLYLVGLIVLWVGKTASNDMTPTPETVTAIVITVTPLPSSTMAPPTAYPTPTSTDTPTITPTRTFIPTPTATLEPTFTSTPVPTDTEVPTQTSVITEIPTQEVIP